MYEFHTQKQLYFDWMYYISRDYIIPFIKDFVPLNQKLNVLEIGCAEAGVLKAFAKKGHQCVGIELEEARALTAQEFLKTYVEQGLVHITNKNIYDVVDVDKEFGTQFDLIILKDVIEHIPEQERFIPLLKKFLKPQGKVFFAFPPWQMPFGGHQQLATNRFLSKLPYYHLLPMPLYKGILKLGGEPQATIDGLVEVKETGISIERFESIVQKSGFKIVKQEHHLFNPIYQFKFNLKMRHQASWITKLPYLRNFLTTGVYYLIE